MLTAKTPVLLEPCAFTTSDGESAHPTPAIIGALLSENDFVRLVFKQEEGWPAHVPVWVKVSRWNGKAGSGEVWFWHSPSGDGDSWFPYSVGFPILFETRHIHTIRLRKDNPASNEGEP